MWRTERTGPAQWTTAETWGREDEVPWHMKVRGGRAYLTSYAGDHYEAGSDGPDVFFSVSDDGITWNPVDSARPVVYHGGVSEVAFEFDADGGLWAVTRNEDGDTSGFGSHVCHAPADALAHWECPTQRNPNRYDSPWMFRHGDDVYLVARRDVDGQFDEGLHELDFADRRQQYLVDYWNRPKRTALYRLDTAAREVVHLVDLLSARDAFPSVRRTGAHTFLIANDTSPLNNLDRSWVSGQGADDGTQIYFLTLSLVPRR